MQLNKVLKEKQPSMKRGIFAKSSHFIEASISVNRGKNEWCFGVIR